MRVCTVCAVLAASSNAKVGWMLNCTGWEMYSRTSFGAHLAHTVSQGRVEKKRDITRVSIPAAVALPFGHSGWSGQQ